MLSIKDFTVGNHYKLTINTSLPNELYAEIMEDYNDYISFYANDNGIASFLNNGWLFDKHGNVIQEHFDTVL